MIDVIATMTPREYRTVKARLEREGMWNEPALQDESTERAVEILAELRK